MGYYDPIKPEDADKVSFSAEGPPKPEDYALAKYDTFYSPPLKHPREAEIYRRELIEFCKRLPRNVATVSQTDWAEVAGLKKYLEQATVVLWSMELWHIATQGSEAFKDEIIKPSMVNPPVQLWIPDRGYHITPEAQEILGTGGRDELYGSLVIEDEYAQKYGVFVTIPIFVKSMREPSAAQEIKDNPMLGIPFFKPMCSLLGQPAKFKWQLDYMALCNFMQLQVVEVKQYIASRPERRRAMKANVTLPDLRVVQLRRRTMQVDQVTVTPEGSALQDQNILREQREWSCHWLVGAHWRQQWYPSEQKHKPKFIAPYSKGDPDKPFKAPSKTIYAIVR